jgi:hypothetical protein
MGLKYVGTVIGAPHAYIFKKIGKLSLNKARRIESIAKFASPLLNSVFSTYTSFKQLLKFFRS